MIRVHNVKAERRIILKGCITVATRLIFLIQTVRKKRTGAEQRPGFQHRHTAALPTFSLAKRLKIT